MITIDKYFLASIHKTISYLYPDFFSLLKVKHSTKIHPIIFSNYIDLTWFSSSSKILPLNKVNDTRWFILQCYELVGMSTVLVDGWIRITITTSIIIARIASAATEPSNVERLDEWDFPALEPESIRIWQFGVCHLPFWFTSFNQSAEFQQKNFNRSQLRVSRLAIEQVTCTKHSSVPCLGKTTGCPPVSQWERHFCTNGVLPIQILEIYRGPSTFMTLPTVKCPVGLPLFRRDNLRYFPVCRFQTFLAPSITPILQCPTSI